MEFFKDDEDPRANLDTAEELLSNACTDYMLESGKEYDDDTAIMDMVSTTDCKKAIDLCVSIYYTEVNPSHRGEMETETHRHDNFYIYFILSLMLEDNDKKYQYSAEPRDYIDSIKNLREKLNLPPSETLSKAQQDKITKLGATNRKLRRRNISSSSGAVPLSRAPLPKGSWEKQFNEREREEALIRMGLDPQQPGPDTNFSRALNYARMVAQHFKTRFTVSAEDRKYFKSSGTGKKQKKSKKQRKSRKQKKQRKTMRK